MVRRRQAEAAAVDTADTAPGNTPPPPPQRRISNRIWWTREPCLTPSAGCRTVTVSSRRWTGG